MNKIIADSGELNRIMKVLSRCMDKKISTRSNIQILHENDKLTIRAANGTLFHFCHICHLPFDIIILTDIG